MSRLVDTLGLFGAVLSGYALFCTALVWSGIGISLFASAYYDAFYRLVNPHLPLLINLALGAEGALTLLLLLGALRFGRPAFRLWTWRFSAVAWAAVLAAIVVVVVGSILLPHPPDSTYE